MAMTKPFVVEKIRFTVGKHQGCTGTQVVQDGRLVAVNVLRRANGQKMRPVCYSDQPSLRDGIYSLYDLAGSEWEIIQ